MKRKFTYAALTLVALLLLFSGTVAHNIFGLELDKDSRACFEFGQHAICVSEIKH